MKLTAGDTVLRHGAWIRGQINSTRRGTVISCTTLTPSPQRLLQELQCTPGAWGFLTTKHSPRFANDVALALREKIAAGMDFRVANRL